MENILRLKERVEIAIEIGESYYREFKSGFEGPIGAKKLRSIDQIKADIAKTLVAFSNADGGELFIGIEDDNTVSGLQFSPEKIQEILDASKSSIFKGNSAPVKTSYNN